MAGKAKKIDFGDEEQCSISMGPMIDCVFLLLLYFISVSTIEMERISKKVVLPIAKQGIIEEDESGRFIIDVEWDESDFAAVYKVNSIPFYYPSDLVPLIRRAAGGKNFRVVVRADRQTPYEFTQEIMAAVASANVPNLIFSTTEVEIK